MIEHFMMEHFMMEHFMTEHSMMGYQDDDNTLLVKIPVN